MRRHEIHRESHCIAFSVQLNHLLDGVDGLSRTFFLLVTQLGVFMNLASVPRHLLAASCPILWSLQASTGQQDVVE